MGTSHKGAGGTNGVQDHTCSECLGSLLGISVGRMLILCPLLRPSPFSGIDWRQKDSSPRRESILVTSTCSGMGQPEPATLENPASTYSAPTRRVPSVRSLRDRSTWPTQERAVGSDTDQVFTYPANPRSERRVARRLESLVSDRVLGPTVTL